MIDPTTPLDLLVIGAGLDGMQRAKRSAAAGGRTLLVERSPQPGGSVRTRRSEGHVLELGPVALPAAECAARRRDLARPPLPLDLCDGARSGWSWDGASLRPVAVQGAPQTFAGGNEDLVTAYRRELGARVLLGREVTALRPTQDGGWVADLGGEVPAAVQASQVSLDLPPAQIARLLQSVDPALGDVGRRLAASPVALVFVATDADEAAAAAFRGYGVRVDTDRAAREAVFCSNAFPRRARPGSALVRIELAGSAAAADDDLAVAAAAEAELRHMTGWTGAVRFRRVHRAAEPVRDGAFAEARVRVRHLLTQLPGIGLSADELTAPA